MCLFCDLLRVAVWFVCVRVIVLCACVLVCVCLCLCAPRVKHVFVSCICGILCGVASFVCVFLLFGSSVCVLVRVV